MIVFSKKQFDNLLMKNHFLFGFIVLRKMSGITFLQLRFNEISKCTKKNYQFRSYNMYLQIKIYKYIFSAFSVKAS